MQTNDLETQPPTHRILIVADRKSDSTPVIDVLREKAETQRLHATVLVPASLHGFEWAGDPRAAVPAAELHAALLHVALLNAGVESCEASVGDPDPHAAIDDALSKDRFDEVVINVRSSRLTSALRLGLADRIAPERRAGVTNLGARRKRRPGRARKHESARAWRGSVHERAFGSAGTGVR
jgi:hypothetical protein